nr:hypothetical protein CIT39_14075 [Bradyrhizobium symbiodeficiens]
MAISQLRDCPAVRRPASMIFEVPQKATPPVNELSKDPRLSRRESVNPAARRFDLPRGGWM